MTSNQAGSEEQKFGKGLRKDFLFAEGFVNLNHGSFGTYPRVIRDTLRSYQDQAESSPDEFIRYLYPALLDKSREAISKVLKAPTDTLVFVPNATTGVNTVLRNLKFEKGDKILYFATIYGSCEKTVHYITDTTPAESVKVEYTYPVEDAFLVGSLRDAVKKEKAKGSRVKVAIFDTVVSMPGVKFPYEELTAACKELGVLSLLDAAHGVGQLDVNLGKLDPDFWISNCHKWLHVPRACGIFYVPVRNQHLLPSTLPTSHYFVPAGQTTNGVTPFPASTKPHFVQNFEFVGSIDSTPYLCIPEALKYRESLGGEEAISKYTFNQARQGGKKVAEILDTEVLENSTGTLGECTFSNVRLPLSLSELENVATQNGMTKEETPYKVRDFIQKKLLNDYNTFIPVMFFGGAWWTRFAAQVYLDLDDWVYGAKALKDLSERVNKGEFAKWNANL